MSFSNINKELKNVTVLIITRNEYDQRIINLLTSLKCQSYPAGLIDIIVVDYDKDKQSIPALRDLCRDFNIRAVSVESDFWNKSHAFYVGIKKTSAEYVLVCNCDSIFDKNYIEECVKALIENDRQAFYCGFSDYSQSCMPADPKFSFEMNCLFVKRGLFDQVNSYDEFFKLWGYGDIDFIKGMDELGVELKKINSKTSCIQQENLKKGCLPQRQDFEKYLNQDRSSALQNNFIIKNIQGVNEEDDRIDSFSVIPKFPKKLPGQLWGITVLFNPSGYNNKITNFKQFREQSKRQGLNLLTVELAIGDQTFQLAEKDSDMLIQLRTQGVMWQKERLLNIALEHLPQDCDKIAWIDCDLIFKDDHWVNNVCKLLEEYNVVQPFSEFIRLGKNGDPQDSIKGLGLVKSLIQGSFKVGNPGHVWAARREIFDDLGFYDRLILGSADKLMAYAFIGYIDVGFRKEYNNLMKGHQRPWMREVLNRVKGSVYYCEGLILHLWHGDEKYRFHVYRALILSKFDFDPEKDIKLDGNGCWVWATHKPGLHKNVQEYFWIRNEEGENVIISSIKEELLWERNQRVKIEKDLEKLKHQRQV